MKFKPNVKRAEKSNAIDNYVGGSVGMPACFYSSVCLKYRETKLLIAASDGPV